MGRDADPDGDAPDPLWEAGSYYDAAFAQRRRRRAEARAAAERAGVLIVFSCGWLGVLGPAAVAVFVAFTAGRLGSDDVAGLALVLSINAFPSGLCGGGVRDVGRPPGPGAAGRTLAADAHRRGRGVPRRAAERPPVRRPAAGRGGTRGLNP